MTVDDERITELEDRVTRLEQNLVTCVELASILAAENGVMSKALSYLGTMLESGANVLTKDALDEIVNAATDGLDEEGRVRADRVLTNLSFWRL